MAQKVSPRANRVGYIEDWTSKWFDIKSAPENVEQDFHIREYVKQKFRNAIVPKVVIERTGKQMIVDIHTVRPGIIIGKGGENINEATEHIQKFTGVEKVSIKVSEVKYPSLNAKAVAEFIAIQLEKNVSYRRAVKTAIQRTMESGALGIKVRVSGRLGGVEIARAEWFKEGRVPSNTFRAIIDFGISEALIKKGKIGIKVWIFIKELLTEQERELYRMGRIYDIIENRISSENGVKTNVDAK
ncbi:MAG: 30S ribosomal protein S3 [Endomicrobiia bacterium]